MNHACRSFGVASPRSRMSSRVRASPAHCVLRASSPPTAMYADGNTSMTSSSTLQKNSTVDSSVFSTSSLMP